MPHPGADRHHVDDDEGLDDPGPEGVLHRRRRSRRSSSRRHPCPPARRGRDDADQRHGGGEAVEQAERRPAVPRPIAWTRVKDQGKVEGHHGGRSAAAHQQRHDDDRPVQILAPPASRCPRTIIAMTTPMTIQGRDRRQITTPAAPAPPAGDGRPVHRRRRSARPGQGPASWTRTGGPASEGGSPVSTWSRAHAAVPVARRRRPTRPAPRKLTVTTSVRSGGRVLMRTASRQQQRDTRRCTANIASSPSACRRIAEQQAAIARSCPGGPVSGDHRRFLAEPATAVRR